MSLTAGEETYIKKMYQEQVLQDQINVLNKIAADELTIKRSEITAIQEKLTSDIAVINSQIAALK